MIKQPQKITIEQELTKYKQMEKSLQQRNQELALINKATQAFNSSLDIDQVLRVILDEMHRLMDILSTSFWLHEPETNHLVCQHATGPGQQEIIGWRLSPGQGVTGYAAQTGQTIIIADTRTDTRHFKDVDRKIGVELCSLLCLPLKVKQDVIGVLNLADTQPGRFSAKDLRLLEPIAAAAANAIQNARLFDEARRQRKSAEERVEELSFLNQITQTLATVTNLQAALELVAEIITHCFHAFSTGISIYNAARTHRTIVVMYQTENISKLNLVGKVIPLDAAYQEHLSHGRPLVIPNPQSSRYTVVSRQSVVERNLQCLMLIPLWTRGEIIGTISVSTNQKERVFTPAEVRLAETIASQIAGTIEVARLFEEEQQQKRLAEQRIEELLALNRITQMATRTIDMQSVLETVTQEITGLFNAYSTSISLFDMTRQERTITVMHDPYNTYGPSLTGFTIPFRQDPLSRKIIETRQSLIIDNPQTHPVTRPYQDFIRARGIKCLLLTPLMARAEVIGIIGISITDEGRKFTPQEAALAETIAGQLAGAVANARLFEEEQRQRQIVESRNRELDAFARTVAHDLKNPISTMAGYAELLLNGYHHFTADELQEIFQSVQRSAHKTLNIIDELLLLAGVHRQSIPLTPIHMHQIIAQVQDRLALMIDEYQGQITMPNKWPQARGYAPWVEEVWANYISNGLKYGGKPPRLELGATPQADGFIRYWVKDNGAGLSPQAQAALFTEFTRLDEFKVEGHGLGLSIVRRIIEKLGGQVGVESSGVPGQGSAFYFTLPGANKED